MLLTTKARYGLLAAKYLAQNWQRGTLSAADLAEAYGLHHEALAKELQRLVEAGVLVSRHGMSGGYQLARDPRQVTVLDIIRASAEFPFASPFAWDSSRAPSGF